MRFSKSNPTLKNVLLPGDKSISHRLLLMGAMAEGTSEILNLSTCEDVQATIDCLRALGVEILCDENRTVVHGVGFHGFQAPKSYLDCHNSGTTARHLLAMLSVCDFESVVTGDESLSRRPMRRVADPVIQMGGRVQLANGNLPARVGGSRGPFQNLQYKMEIASAQVKSSLLLAGAIAGVEVELSGRTEGRDHTENLVKLFGGQILREDGLIKLPRQDAWKAAKISVPADPSAAAFWVTAALLAQKSLRIEGVLLNESRMGFFKAIKNMGAEVRWQAEVTTPEPVGWLEVDPSVLAGVEISTQEIPSMIDEVPLLALLASQAKGNSTIVGAGELRKKETDRIAVTEIILASLGIWVESTADGFHIEGGQSILGGTVDPRGDHRLAMLGAIASFGASGDVEVLDAECSRVSDPYFLKNFGALK